MAKKIEPSDYIKILPEVRSLVGKIIKKNMADGIMFSAGTDTSIIAYEAVKINPKIQALTVEFEHGIPKDKKYVEKMVDFLNLNHEVIVFGHNEMVEASEKVIEILKTFDHMEVRNSTPVYIGLVGAKKRGIKSVFTGDALDEFFGYPWQFHLSEAEFVKELSAMWNEMRFSALPLGKAVGVEVKQPYLDPSFVEFAKKIPAKLKVRIKNGVKYGKWLMRKSYEDLIPNEVAWRGKAPCEQGTGTEVLPTYFDNKISTNDFETKKQFYLEKDQVNLSTKEQLFYYEIFRKKFGIPSDVYNDKSGKQCPNCKGYVNRRTKFCRICGTYPI
ncbi:7-cyano-7-deazaguanine synthase [Candidatus Bathyarchaeota archaeon]|nr:7-cyano-7-deazaguanine synthase [Candidatus Bathyarchaeota archaeon]